MGLFKEMTKKDKCVFWKLLEKLGLVFGVDIIVIYRGGVDICVVELVELNLLEL